MRYAITIHILRLYCELARFGLVEWFRRGESSVIMAIRRINSNDLTSESFMERLAERIVEAREALGYTQAQLAERVPCNPQTVSNWETGRRQPRYADLLRLAEILGRPVSWFLGEPQSRGSLDAVRERFASVGRELAAIGELLRRDESPAADRLVPIVGWVDAVDGEFRAEPQGWRHLVAAEAEQVKLYRVRGERPEAGLRHGDLLAIAAAGDLPPDALVMVRDGAGRERLCRRVADGLEGVEQPVTILGVVRWLQREFGESPDPAAAAAARLAWLGEATGRIEALESRLEAGEGKWSELESEAEAVAAAAEALRAVYGASALQPAARALARMARAAGEQGRYAAGLALAKQAAEYDAEAEQLGERSRDALNNLYNLSQLAIFEGDLALARSAAEQAATADDWSVRWKALKNLAELDVNFDDSPFDESLGQDILDLAAAHRDDDPQQALLAEAVAHEIRGNAWFTRGEPARALVAAEAELAAATAAGLPYRLVNALLNVAQYALALGSAARARAVLEQAAPLCAAQDLGDLEAMRLAHTVGCETLQGHLPEARLALLAALRLAYETGSKRAVLMAELGGLLLAQVTDGPAAVAAHAAAARRQADALGLVPYRRVIDRLVSGAGQ